MPLTIPVTPQEEELIRLDEKQLKTAKFVTFVNIDFVILLR